jgi:hypothetical protein
MGGKEQFSFSTEFLKMSSDKRNASRKYQEPIEDPDDKLKVECICPKCAKRHIMNFHWIGRGTPRKFCQNCRDNM